MRYFMDYGFGRLHSIDFRDLDHPMQLFGAAEDITDRRKIWWDGTFWGNQGETSQCVEYAWHHYVAAQPVNGPWKAPFWEYGSVYRESQTVDEWEGEDYDGTSVRAGAKVLQRLGFIGEYQWAFDVETVIRHLIFKGPVVVGTNFYTSMFYPDSRGVVEVRGDIEGGHAYVLTGVNMRKRLIRVKNSWGRGFGKMGRFWIPVDDMARLIDEDGEACIATEIKV